MVTHCPGHTTALMTVRGKDHDLTEVDARDLARRFEEIANILGREKRALVQPKPWTPGED